MSFRDRVLKATNVLLEESPSNKDNRPRQLDESDIDGFMEAAEHRDDPLWDDIFLYLRGELRREYPLRATRIERELKWLRKRAYKSGLPWGAR